MKESFEMLPLVDFVGSAWSMKSVVGYVRIERRFHITETKVHVR